MTILKYGKEEQKRKHIPGIVSGKFIALFIVTKPDAGSDISAIRATAVKKGDYYIINEAKTWITNAISADIGLIWVYTNKEKGYGGISCFIVDMKETPGIQTKKIEKRGLRCCEAKEVVFEDVKVPKNLLEEANQE
uniref:Acyl-CoA oxidase/dehydrogenase middle domain-containing protein n=1 Tax=candidate division WOR-3 bacterium TaxID=2052148 RepID=A0A7C2PLW8_UNCW3